MVLIMNPESLAPIEVEILFIFSFKNKKIATESGISFKKKQPS
jgi:hypothetical protein